MLNKSHSLSRFATNGGKNNNKKKMMHFHFDPAVRVFVPSDWAQDTTSWQFFFCTLYMVDSIFSRIVWTNTLHDFDEGIYFPNNICYGNNKRHFFNDKWKMLQQNRSLMKNMNSTEKNKLIGYLLFGEMKLRNLKNAYFEKKNPMVKKT